MSTTEIYKPIRMPSETKKAKQKSSKAQQPKTLNEEVRFTQNVVKKGLRNVASHHIESFNYAMKKCLPRICNYMLPVEVSSSTATGGDATTQDAFPFTKYRMWFESFELRKPSRPAAGGQHGLLMGSDQD